MVLVLAFGTGCAGAPRLPIPDWVTGASDPASAAPAPQPPEAGPTDLASSPLPPAPAVPSASGPAPAGVATRAGTRVGFGEQATVDADYANKRGIIGITVTGIEKGSPVDLDQLRLGDQASGYTPYYIQVSVTNLSDTDFGYASLTTTGIKGQLRDGSPATPLRITGSFPRCKSGFAPANFVRGATYRSCEVFLAPAATVVDKVAFTGVGYDPSFYDNPIVWSRR